MTVTINTTEFRINEFKEQVGSTIWPKAKQLFDQGGVLSINADGGSIKGEVHDERTYPVILSKKPNGYWASECTCLQRYGPICVHGVALGIACDYYHRLKLQSLGEQNSVTAKPLSHQAQIPPYVITEGIPSLYEIVLTQTYEVVLVDRTVTVPKTVRRLSMGGARAQERLKQWLTNFYQCKLLPGYLISGQDVGELLDFLTGVPMIRDAQDDHVVIFNPDFSKWQIALDGNFVSGLDIEILLLDDDGPIPLEEVLVFSPEHKPMLYTGSNFYSLHNTPLSIAINYIGGLASQNLQGKEAAKLLFDIWMLARKHRIKVVNKAKGLFKVIDNEKPITKIKLSPQGSDWALDLFFQYQDVLVPAAPPLQNSSEPVVLKTPDGWTALVRNHELEFETMRELDLSRVKFAKENHWVILPKDAFNFYVKTLPRFKDVWKVETSGNPPRLSDLPLELNLELHPVEDSRMLEYGDYSLTMSYRFGDQTFSTEQVWTEAKDKEPLLEVSPGVFATLDPLAVERLQNLLQQAAHFKNENYYVKGHSLPALEEDLPKHTGNDPLLGLRQGINGFAGLPEMEQPTALKAQLRGYQLIGLRWLYFLKQYNLHGILADDMGLGKTIETIAYLTKEKEQAKLEPVLIVAPTSVVFNWKDEIARFAPHLTAISLGGAERHEYWSKLQNYDIVLTSYALLRRDIEKLKEYQWGHVILDEGQNIKNARSQTAHAAKSIVAKRRLVLTGTPMENRLEELWSIFDFLMPGFLGTSKDFQGQFAIPIQRQQDTDRARILRKKIAPFILRRRKEEVATELPPKSESTLRIPLEEGQNILYQQILAAAKTRVFEKIHAKGLQGSQIDILSALTRLRQVCCHPRILGLELPPEQRHSAKFDTFRKLIEEIASGGHRVLVFSQFVEMLKLMRQFLDKIHLPYCYLDGSTTNREAVVKDFQTNDKNTVFLLSLKAGGVGLNLTGADYVIHYDPWWNPSVENQATDRAYRIGQTKKVMVYRLITEGTVEAKIQELQQKKSALFKQMVDDEAQVAGSLTMQDIEDLFS